MSPTQLYTLRHLQLREALQDPEHVGRPGKWYSVFWQGQVPLGHLFEGFLRPVTGVEAKQKIWEAIAPALEYYARQAGKDISSIKGSFFGGNYKEFFLSLTEMLSSVMILPENDLPNVSLVICTRNRSASLQKCLAELSNQCCRPAEVIVVDNAPDDDSTEQLVSGFSGIRYIREPGKGLDHARNTGITAARSGIVAFADDDVILHPGWILRIAQNFKDPAVQAAAGLVLPAVIDTEAQYYFEKYWSFNRGYLPVRYDRKFFEGHLPAGVPVWQIGAGAGMAFRRSVFDALGAFDVRLDAGAAGCNGDSEIWYRILAEGWEINYDPLAVAYHSHRREMTDFKKQIYYYMRGFSAAVLIEYRRYGNRGELRHLLRTLPAHYLKGLRQAIAGDRNGRWVTLGQEVAGWLTGIGYDLVNRKHPPFDVQFHRDLPPADIAGAPLVSVIITTYNHYRYLPEAIESVLRQDYKNIELIVVDDGSTDLTRELMKDYPTAKYCPQSNQGLSAARNMGIIESKGAFIIFLDADDWLYPGAVTIQVSQFGLHPTAAFIAGSHDKVNNLKEILDYPEPAPPENDIYTALLKGNFIGMHAAVMYRREVFDHFRFDTRLKACEDYDLCLRTARLFKTSCHSRKIAAYRIHAGNMSADTALMLASAGQTLRKQYALLPVSRRYPFYREGLRNWKEYYDGVSLKVIPNMKLRKLKKSIKELLPASVKRRLYRWRLLKHYIPPQGKINWGDLEREAPFSREFGYDRGGPVDRYYIENFLEDHAAAVHGRVLEIGDNAYTRRFGGDRVSHSDILHVDQTNPAATIIGDLARLPHVESDQFDCIILTQTLHLVYDLKSALQTCHRILKHNGVLLITAPGITNIDHDQWAVSWFWSFTGLSLEMLLSETFGNTNVRVQSFGNLFAATAFLYGIGAGEISREKKDWFDPHYPVIIAASVIKKEA